jgi:hypothetical protein
MLPSYTASVQTDFERPQDSVPPRSLRNSPCLWVRIVDKGIGFGEESVGEVHHGLYEQHTSDSCIQNCASCRSLCDELVGYETNDWYECALDAFWRAGEYYGV